MELLIISSYLTFEQIRCQLMFLLGVFSLLFQSQMRRRDEVMSCDIQELEASLRQQEVVREQETPAEEIARLKEASMDEHINMDREVG